MKNEAVTFGAVVEKGRGLGSRTVVPTINLHVDPGVGFGVYLCGVKVDDSFYFGLMNYGRRPTFNLGESLVEIFLLDFSGNLYGQKVEVTVYNRLRGIKKFTSAAQLKDQIDRDIVTARQIIKTQHV